MDKKLRALGYWFDVAEADRVCTFFEQYLRHSKGEWKGQPVILAPWQRRALRRLFGWRRPDGTRRYRRSSWWIPKKNGKSTIFAGICLYLQQADGEPGAEVYSAAADEEQANNVFGEAQRMTESSPELSARTQVRKNSLYVEKTGSVFRVLTSKARTKHGFSVHGVVLDEIHAIKNRDLYDTLTGAGGARRQPMELTISTAGDDVGGWAYELWEYAVKARDGLYDDPHFLSVVFAADPEDDWRDEKTWAKANPNLGISCSIDSLREEFAKTRGMPSSIARFKRLHLNLWTQSAEAWLQIDKWRECLVEPRKISEYRGKKCWGGMDLSSTTDLTAFVLVFDMGDGQPFEVVPFFWCPRDTIQERQRADNTTYATWAEQGYLRTTPGNVVDYAMVKRDIVKIRRYTKLLEVAYDDWNATPIVQDLQDDHGLTMVPIRQGYKSLSPPSKELERRHLSKGLRIVNNPVLTWMASIVAVQRDRKSTADGIKPVKQRPTHRIDGIVALVMALSRATLGEDTSSVYEERGLSQL